jgi:tetratricopeptide (TPR) repeat protein
MFAQWPDCNRACAIWVCLLLAACQPVARTTVGAPAAQVSPIDSSVPVSAAGKILLAEELLLNNQFNAGLALYLKAAAQSQQPEVAQRAAFLARQVGSPEQSQQALARWLALSPDDLSAHEASFISATEQDRFDEAETELDTILTLNSEYTGHWLASFWAGLPAQSQTQFSALLTRVAASHDNTSLAIVVTEIKNRESQGSGTDWIDAWIDAHGLDSSVALYRAQLFLPDRKRAMAQLENYPNYQTDAGILSQLGRWHGSEGDAVRAREFLEKAVQIDPSRHQDALTLALLLIQDEEFADAEIRLKALLAQERFRPNAYYHLGEIALALEENQLAIDRFLRVDQGELIVEARKQLAQLAVATGQPTQADRWFAEARLLFTPFQQQLILAEAQFRSSRGEAAAAIPILTEALAREPNDRQILYTRALAYESIGNIAGAEADLRSILTQDPEDPDALNALGYTLADRTDRFDEALVLIEKALSKKPNSAAILDSMGWVLFKLGRVVESVPYFEKAWAIVQDHEIAAHYGEVLWTLGRKLEAQQIWQQGYESTPESDKIRGTIQRLTDS